MAATPPSSSTTSRVSSFEKTVLLHDWWLIKVEDECSRARLAVGGFTITTGKVRRIFTSAPIVKRYDGYTLETADGYTVMIQGLINASRMHQNGFPSVACNHFRIGFPYCWKELADRYFQTDTEGNDAPTCASDIHESSRDSANTESYSLPVCSKEFPVGRIVECLNSICKKLVDGAQTSTDTAQNLCKNNDCKENMNAVVTQADGNIVVSDENNNVAEENPCMATNNVAQDGMKQVRAHVSSDSLLCGNMNSDSLLEVVTGFQRESLATAVAGPDNEKQQLGHASIDVDGLVKNIDGNTCCINAASAVDSRPNVFLSKSLPENWEESVSIAPDANRAGNEAEQVVHISVTTSSHESDVEHMNSPNLCKNNDCKENMNGVVTQAGVNIVVSNVNTNVAEENAYMATNNDAQDGPKQLSTHVSSDSLLCGNMNSDSLLEEVTGFQRESLATAVAGPDNEKQQFGCASINVDGLMKDINGNSCCINAASAVDSGANDLAEVLAECSEEVLAEYSYNEANDLQLESSKKLPIHTYYFMNSPSKVDIHPEENSTGLLHVGMTVSESPNKQFSLRRSERLSKLRRSERLSKLRISAEDAERSLEHNKGSLHKTNAKLVADGTHNRQGSTLNINKGTSVTQESHVNSADIHAVVARKLNFSLHKSLHGYSNTSNEDKMHINLDGNNISSKKHVVRASQEELLTSQGRRDTRSQKTSKNGSNKSSQKTSKNGSNKNSSVVDSGKNQVLSSSEGYGFLDSENTVRDTHGLTGIGIEADAQNFDMPTGEQSNARPAETSRKRSRFALQVGRTPLTRQRTKELSLASPELLNFKRSRSGRLLVPTLSNWCQQILYDVDGSVAGILTGVDAIKCDRRGTRSEPSRRKNKKKKVI